jgi:hypothetical protein
LDGLVNDDDATIVPANYNQVVNAWAEGDLDFDGTVDGDETVLGALYPKSQAP